VAASAPASSSARGLHVDRPAVDPAGVALVLGDQLGPGQATPSSGTSHYQSDLCGSHGQRGWSDVILSDRSLWHISRSTWSHGGRGHLSGARG
jgi:hypothetical protein